MATRYYPTATGGADARARRVEPAGNSDRAGTTGWTWLRAVALCLVIGLVPAAHAAELSGTIEGVVMDRATQQPLAWANLALLDTELGAIADSDGRFTVTRVPVGTYRLRASMMGYEQTVRPDLVVRANRITTVTIGLAEQAVELQETVVHADFFATEEKETVSAVSFGNEEIRRSPGSAQDISRLLQALPSVNLNSDQRNDLIVRGGSPMESMVLLDHIEIPNINHFPTQGASGGPIGMLNVDLISQADFSAGGFGAAYGDRMSSVLEVGLREGNRKEFDGEFSTGMAGAGLILEGPVQHGRGSWLLSARRSYLDLIVGAIGTGAVPKYSDVQGKATYDLGEDHQLTLLGLGGSDHIEVKPTDSEEIDDYGVADDDQAVVGASWRWLWGSRGYSSTSLAYSCARYAGHAEDGLTHQPFFANDSVERETVLHSDYYLRLGSRSNLSWGLVAKHQFPRYELFVAADTNRLGVEVPELRLAQEVRANKAGAYLSVEQTLGQRVRARAGVRYDYDGYGRQGNWAPRLGLTCRLGPETDLNAAYGVYYQSLPLSLVAQDPGNRRLHTPRATHWVLGLTHRLTPSTQLSVEAFAKEYARLPYDPDDPTVSVIDGYADGGSPLAGRLVGGGRARSRGAELLLQKKLAQSLYGTCSYSYSQIQYTDLNGVRRNRAFDNRHLASLIVGYRPSDQWEVSGRWSLAGGRPYTPFDQDLSAQLHTGVIRPELVNSQRYPAYHRLDLEFDYRWHYEHLNLVSYCSLLNSYNRSNIYAYYWDKDRNAMGRVNQWSLLPIVGLEVEF